MLHSLNQAHLTLLETCPRKFQYTVLEKLTVPPSPETQSRQQWGSRFHLLMQQREMGLPLAALPIDDDLNACIQGLVAAAPDLFALRPDRLRLSEQRCEFRQYGYLFTVIFDLLLLTAETGEIIDWKTYLTPLSKTKLEQSWQTRLYLYALVETTHLQPEQVSMTYWFVRPSDRSLAPAPSSPTEVTPVVPQHVTLTYSRQQHQQTQADLQRLTQRLDELLETLQTQSQPFPKVALAAGECPQCAFAGRCQRLPEAASRSLVTTLPSLDEIAEVPI
jgi:hypothetical protein